MARMEVSQSMRRNPFVLGLENRLGDDLIFTARRIPYGYFFKADTVKPNGFSLQARLAEHSPETRSVLWIRGDGKEEVRFSPKCTLESNFGCGPAVDNFVTFVERHGTSLTDARGGEQPSVGHYRCLSDVAATMDELVKLLRAMVN